MANKAFLDHSIDIENPSSTGKPLPTTAPTPLAKLLCCFEGHFSSPKCYALREPLTAAPWPTPWSTKYYMDTIAGKCGCRAPGLDNTRRGSNQEQVDQECREPWQIKRCSAHLSRERVRRGGICHKTPARGTIGARRVKRGEVGYVFFELE